MSAQRPTEGGLDAAEAAGFGGITWADDPGDADEAPDHADDTPDPGQGSAPPVEGSTGPTGGAADGGADQASDQASDQGAEAADGAESAPADVSVEDLVADLERVTGERDQYLDASRRLQAEFENYRKAVAKRELEARERANESLVNELLPVLDACDGALASGADDVEPVRTALIDALTKQGLERIGDEETPFDPERHEAVMHDPEENGSGPVVAEVMRAGYSWKGRVVRPAMVRVRG